MKGQEILAKFRGLIGAYFKSGYTYIDLETNNILRNDSNAGSYSRRVEDECAKTANKYLGVFRGTPKSGDRTETPVSTNLKVAFVGVRPSAGTHFLTRA
ncbi:MAG: hypothetical protein PW788_14690 [Micavibrio sp.]|nr:hypothetical protein [Micavibrio sp.]